MKADPLKNKVFAEIYFRNLWGDNESKSGPGSSSHQTEVLRKTLPDFMRRHGIRSMLDIPCGDFHWMGEIKDDLSNILDVYIGGDIVPEIIDSDTLRFADDKFRFQVLDLTISNLPAVDLVLCRDCLVHFSYYDIYRALKSIKNSKAKFLLTTSFINSDRRNRNISTGGWRPLNFGKFPFFFASPVDLIDEQCSENEGIFRDKSLVLWKVKDINLLFLGLMVIADKIRNGIGAIK